MKNLIFVLISLFMFLGCTSKQEFSFPKTHKDDKQKEVKVKEKEISIQETMEEDPISEVLEDSYEKIAVIYPSSKVGRYAKSTINTISAFMINNDRKFKLEAYDTYNEKSEQIILKLNELKDAGYKKVIAMFTKSGFQVLNNENSIDDIKFYFPLINKTEVVTYNENFIFGGISYEKQLSLLESLSSGKNTMFYVKSYLGTKLKNIYETTFSNFGVVKEIARTNNRYKYIMKDNRIKGDTIILNTPIVKSSIILSQLTAFEVNPEKVLSTQLNYNPLLIKLTQEKDRRNFYVVSSISDVDDFFEDYTKMLGSDIAYEWVDYSALVGVNYLINGNESTIVKTNIIENQADYKQTLYKSTSYGFEKVLPN